MLFRLNEHVITVSTKNFRTKNYDLIPLDPGIWPLPEIKCESLFAVYHFYFLGRDVHVQFPPPGGFVVDTHSTDTFSPTPRFRRESSDHHNCGCLF